MNDDLLGLLTEDDRIKGAFIGSVSYLGAPLPLRIDPDGEPFSGCLELARAVAASLPEMDAKARAAAANRYVSVYNESWREYAELDEKGGTVDVSEPEIDEAAFKSRITLLSVSVMGASSCSLEYGDGGLFDGHSILVTSTDGTGFSNPYAMLFG